MKRYLLVAASTCALVLALAAGPAFAGSPNPPGAPLPGGGSQNTALLTNDPVLSGNSVAGINTGDQTSSASPTATQTNGSSATDAAPALGKPGGDDQSQGGDQNVAILDNDPVASGNSVAVINTGSQSSSADPTLTQTNGGSGGSQDGLDKPNGGPDGCSCGGDDRAKEGDRNVAILDNDPVASGNSVAVVNGGGGCGCQGGSTDDGQTSSADPTLTQTNGDDGGSSKGDRNVAILDNDPVASGNSVAVINTGSQSSSADPTLTQTNGGGTPVEYGRPKGYDTSKPDDKSNRGDRNVAILDNDPVASGNSVAVINTGSQSSSADPTLTQTNGKDDRSKPDGDGQKGWQKPKTETKPCPKPEPKPCPKPEPKPCPKPEPKPCPKPEPKPCPEPEPKPCPEPCKPKPCPPTPCDGQSGSGPIGVVTDPLERLL